MTMVPLQAFDVMFLFCPTGAGHQQEVPESQNEEELSNFEHDAMEQPVPLPLGTEVTPAATSAGAEGGKGIRKASYVSIAQERAILLPGTRLLRHIHLSQVIQGRRLPSGKRETIQGYVQKYMGRVHHQL